MSWAVKEKLLDENPCKNVKFLLEEEKKRELLNPQEINMLFGPEWEKYWGKYHYYIMNKLAACTGMRIGEVVGLKGMFVSNVHVFVNGQYSKYGYTDTKNHKEREIPIIDKVIEELGVLKQVNGDGYLFSTDGGKTPVSKKAVSNSLSRALEMAGISNAEQKERGLSFHSWRHFFNTTMLLEDIPRVMVEALTGLSSAALTRRYTKIKRSHLRDITGVQEKMISG